jgi:hypothetical protein
MLTLEEYKRQGKLKVNKVFLDGMTRQASAIHTVYPEYLKRNIKTRVLQNNSPFLSDLFVTVDSEKNTREKVLKTKGSVILASSGMLEGGASLRYFYELAENENNKVIFIGYQARNSLGYKVQRGLKTLPISQENGKTKVLEIKCKIETADAFSGHAYRSELFNFFNNLKPRPKTVIINHGDSCHEFAKQLSRKYHVNATAIKDLESIRLR